MHFTRHKFPNASPTIKKLIPVANLSFEITQKIKLIIKTDNCFQTFFFSDM